MVGANWLKQTYVLALTFGLCDGALPFRTGDLSLMHAARLWLWRCNRCNSSIMKKILQADMRLSSRSDGPGIYNIGRLFPTHPRERNSKRSLLFRA
eukprot:1161732-Pelagomonas_calceolata.AAC.5